MDHQLHCRLAPPLKACDIDIGGKFLAVQASKPGQCVDRAFLSRKDLAKTLAEYLSMITGAEIIQAHTQEIEFIRGSQRPDGRRIG